MAKGHGPVNNNKARACMKNYETIFKGAIDPKIKEAYTECVVFDRALLITWLNTLTTDSIKISLGIYDQDFVNTYPTAKHNRLTAFLTPFNSIPQKSNVLSAPDPDAVPPNDDPLDNTFNLGTLTP